MRYGGGRRRSISLQPLLLLFGLVTGLGLLILALKPLDPPIRIDFPGTLKIEDLNSFSLDSGGARSCATVEEMGKDFRRNIEKESLRVRRIIENHFVINGTF